MKLQHLKSVLGIVMAMTFNSPAEAISPLNRTLLCDPEIIRLTDGVIKNYDWEILADWQLAISEEKDKFVVLVLERELLPMVPSTYRVMF